MNHMGISDRRKPKHIVGVNEFLEPTFDGKEGGIEMRCPYDMLRNYNPWIHLIECEDHIHSSDDAIEEESSYRAESFVASTLNHFIRYKGYVINGFRHQRNRKTKNSGLVVQEEIENGKKDFKFDVYNEVRGVKRDKYGALLVNDINDENNEDEVSEDDENDLSDRESYIDSLDRDLQEDEFNNDSGIHSSTQLIVSQTQAQPSLEGDTYQNDVHAHLTDRQKWKAEQALQNGLNVYPLNFFYMELSGMGQIPLDMQCVIGKNANRFIDECSRWMKKFCPARCKTINNRPPKVHKDKWDLLVNHWIRSSRYPVITLLLKFYIGADVKNRANSLRQKIKPTNNAKSTAKIYHDEYLVVRFNCVLYFIDKCNLKTLLNILGKMLHRILHKMLPNKLIKFLHMLNYGRG
ncbi:LOW QUALITY PROTEIN: hypothetical protein Cgig2_009860 [Carnegiea gigantea]|uniref:Uncharacterized protein n=1 Tax=Carnegiea gigantea TaxID=171969 RepID=A0A9Q1KK60_9CARY|nr:LOW QUALITY PROTEIN: hypothetical protein Cgig2_009860 [Carnegiea gigantea]